MASKSRMLTADHPVVITFLILAVIGVLSVASEILKPLAFAILLSFALAPAVRFLEHLRVPRLLAIVLTVVLVLAALGAVGYKVGEQVTSLATRVDPERLKENIHHKFSFLKPGQQGALVRLSEVVSAFVKALDSPTAREGSVAVHVVARPSFAERLQSAVGPYLGVLGEAAFVLILVLFILATREDLSDRIIRLAGLRRISLTTKTMEEAGQRISRYLLVYAVVNSTVGLIVGTGLWAIGVPLAMLWGVLAGLLRFIPYLGPATAFALPLLFSVATFEGWREPLMVVALFAALETAANSVLEPVIYGKTTGVSSLGILVAAMFWTWLWGILGLLLSTPMTVCLAVLGKSVPGLQVFDTLLSEDPPLGPDVRFYHRLVAMDQDGASEVIDAELEQRPRADVFDEVLVPTLSRAERDFARGDIDDRERTFILRFVDDLLDDLTEAPEVDLETLAPEAVCDSPGGPAVRVLGVAANDRADALVLKMLKLLLGALGCPMSVLSAPESPLKLTERILGLDPQLVVLSHLPPDGFTTARYLVRRLRARFADLAILVGRWGDVGAPEEVASRLTELGASSVVFKLADARERILRQVCPGPETDAGSKSPEGTSTSLLA